MSSAEQVAKKVLIEQIRRIIIDGESSLLTILTDQRRSIMFRFSEGKLIRSHCRSRNVEDAIIALNECEKLKFTQASTQPQDQPEVIGAEELLQAISLDDFIEPPVAQPAAVSVPHIVPERRPLVERVEKPAVATGPPVDQTLQNEFAKIAGDYIGRVANVLVPTIFAKQLSMPETIDEIAAAIPVAEYASAFRKRAQSFTVGLKDNVVVEQTVEEPETKKEPEHRLFF